MSAYRPLTSDEVRQLVQAGCVAADWSKIQVKEGFDPNRIREVRFAGEVRIGALNGKVVVEGGMELRAGIMDATIADCTFGDNVRISNVRGHLTRYDVGDGAVIMDVGSMATNPGATFGNGIEVEAVNEAGGREIKLFNEISSQFAYLMAMHRYRPKMIEKLEAMVESYVEKVKSDRGTVGAGAKVMHSDEIIDVNIGPDAKISGAWRLTNGTILSEPAAATFVGAGVVADGFIFAEGCKVDSGAVLTNVFVGQGSKVGRQFSAENCLFFANCECFHSEAVAVFGGPYTVTHHRSTLLIAGVFSFFNAGSGTNQSNHMYKLGPAHQGLLERGSKTGSFSYMLWPCVLSPFSVVIGKNMTNFDISNLPFSYVVAEEDGSYLTPAMNMFTVGTTRDGAKWPARDRRTASKKRDLISFEVFSPYVVGRMVRGQEILGKLAAETPKETQQIRYNGVTIKRLLLRNGAKNYGNAVDMVLGGKILERIAGARAKKDRDAIKKALAVDSDAVFSRDWSDVSGLLIARDRLDSLRAEIETGKIATVEDFNKAFTEAWASYDKDEWAWVHACYEERAGKSLDDHTLEDFDTMEAAWKKARASFIKKILADGEKEFDDSSQLGFGIDGADSDVGEDFKAVRGTFEDNSFIKKMRSELAELS